MSTVIEKATREGASEEKLGKDSSRRVYRSYPKGFKTFGISNAGRARKYLVLKSKSAIPIGKVSIWITSKRSIDVYFTYSEYVKSSGDVKKIAILFGLKSFESTLKLNNFILNRTLIEIMFTQSELVFFLTKDEKKLFAYTSSKYQQEHGPLKEITALKALKKYGITTLEETIEKGSVTLHGNSN